VADRLRAVRPLGVGRHVGEAAGARPGPRRRGGPGGVERRCRLHGRPGPPALRGRRQKYCLKHFDACEADERAYDLTQDLGTVALAAWGLDFARAGLDEGAGSDLDGGAASARRNSFPGNTKVALANGRIKRIDAVRVGGHIVSTDPITGVTKSEKVTNFIVTKTDRDFIDLTVATPDGAKAVTSTQHHPYWNESRRERQNAADLHAGDTSASPTDRLCESWRFGTIAPWWTRTTSRLTTCTRTMCRRARHPSWFIILAAASVTYLR
jgi:hypothetical protein